MGHPSILFIIGVLDSGGVSKSILSLLHVIDKERYDVSLLIMSGGGVLSGDVPKGVRVVTDESLSAMVGGVRGVFRLLKSFHLFFAVCLLIKLFLSVFSRSVAAMFLAKVMPVVTTKQYDLIVDYNGQLQTYYMVNRLCGKKKVCFFHSDYRKWRFYEYADRRYYHKVDAVFTISPTCVDALKEVFPEHAEKVRLMENITSPDLIQALSKTAVSYQKIGKKLLVTIGHVWKMKGADTALLVAKRLQERGVDFEWLFIGAVGKDCDYRKMAKDMGLEECVSYMGVLSNPYPFLRMADVVVHLSLFEGKSIALDEAKLLCKPIVVTNFSTVGDQFENRKNATIVPIGDVEAVANAIEELLQDDALKNSYVSSLQNEAYDNSKEVNKIYELL